MCRRLPQDTKTSARRWTSCNKTTATKISKPVQVKRVTTSSIPCKTLATCRQSTIFARQALPSKQFWQSNLTRSNALLQFKCSTLPPLSRLKQSLSKREEAVEEWKASQLPKTCSSSNSSWTRIRALPTTLRDSQPLLLAWESSLSRFNCPPVS